MKQSWRMERRVFLLHLWTLWSLKKNGFSWYCLVKHLRLLELFENIDQSETNVFSVHWDQRLCSYDEKCNFETWFSVLGSVMLCSDETDFVLCTDEVEICVIMNHNCCNLNYEGRNIGKKQKSSKCPNCIFDYIHFHSTMKFSKNCLCWLEYQESMWRWISL